MSYRDEEPSVPLIVSSGRSVVALDRRSGETIWKNDDLADAAGGALLVTPSRIYLVGWRLAGAIDATSGATIWTTEVAVAGRPGLLLDGDRLLIAAHGLVECLAIDGRRLWSAKVARQGSVSMAIGERTAYDDRD